MTEKPLETKEEVLDVMTMEEEEEVTTEGIMEEYEGKQFGNNIMEGDNEEEEREEEEVTTTNIMEEHEMKQEDIIRKGGEEGEERAEGEPKEAVENMREGKIEHEKEEEGKIIPSYIFSSRVLQENSPGVTQKEEQEGKVKEQEEKDEWHIPGRVWQHPPERTMTTLELLVKNATTRGEIEREHLPLSFCFE